MSGPFRIVYSSRTYEQLEQFALLALGEGRQQEFRDSLAAILKALRLVPEELGESRSFYSKMRIQGRIYFIGSLTVDFGVHLDQPLVFIRKFHWRQRR